MNKNEENMFKNYSRDTIVKSDAILLSSIATKECFKAYPELNELYKKQNKRAEELLAKGIRVEI